MSRRASSLLRSFTSGSETLLETLEDDLPLIYEGELSRLSWGMWQKGWWKLCWADNRREEAVLLHFAQRFDSKRMRGRKDMLFLRQIRTLQPFEKHEVTVSLTGNVAPNDGLHRFAIELLNGTSVMMAAPTRVAREEWLGVIYRLLVAQSKGGFHDDPTIVASIQAILDELERQKQQNPAAATLRAEAPAAGATLSGALHDEAASVLGEHERSPPQDDPPGTADLLDLSSF